MYSWVTLKHIVDWTGAKVSGPAAQIESRLSTKVPAVSTDSRALSQGELFIPIKGESFDGHDFLSQAEKRGAVAVLSDRPVSLGIPVLQVSDTVRALAAIGEKLRDHFQGKVIAVTGSAGKSSTKEMIACLLGEKTIASPASFNNLMGVSRTLCLVEDDTRFLVLEMGMNALGEIRELCAHFKPQAGLISNIGDAHIGKLGGKRGIYQAKKELFDYLAGHRDRALGVALNIDDPLVDEAFREAFEGRMHAETYSLRADSPAAVRVLRHGLNPKTGFLSLDLTVAETTLSCDIPIFGLHQAQNIAAAAAACRLLGVSIERIRERLPHIRPASHRGEVIALEEGRVLIDESYNSNPTALTSALTSIADFEPTRRRVLVLGEMRELGEFSEPLHLQVAQTLVQLQRRVGFPMLVVGVGAGTQPLVNEVKRALPETPAFHTPAHPEALTLLRPLLRPGDIVFVKGSRGIELDRLVGALVPAKK